MKCKEYARLIAERFDEAELFTRRFGSFSKADYEILMFSIYLDMQTEPVRDYDISIALGMTETKVRSLRVKSQLLYPRTISWCDELQKALTKGQYNPDKMTITVMIEDPSVQNLLKSKIESAYGPVYLSFNPKLLTLPVESYLLLAMELMEDKAEAMSVLNRIWSRDHTDAERITRESLLKSLWSKANKAGPLKLILTAAKTAWPVASPLLSVVESLIP